MTIVVIVAIIILYDIAVECMQLDINNFTCPAQHCIHIITIIFAAGTCALMIIFGILHLLSPLDTFVCMIIWTFIYNITIKIASYA